MTGSAGQLRVPASHLKEALFPLAPLPEQQRIVAEIEKQFTRLDAAVVALKRTKANLKRYRAAVLKAAVEGKLTEDWRAANLPAEDGPALLRRILAERRQKWEQEQLAKFAASGKQPPKNWQAKYVEPVAPDVGRLPGLVTGWGWATIGQVTECLDYMRVPVNRKEREGRPGTVPYFGANGQVGWIDDFLFDEPIVLVVEDETFTGREKPFCYKVTGKSWVNNHAHVLRPTAAVDLDYLNYSLSYYPFTPLTTGTTGRKKLTQVALMAAPFVLPPLTEQAQIVAEVDRRLSVVAAVEAEVETNLRRAAQLRQSILKRAFAGELVPQDPSDEPASVLLERIRQERAGSGPPARSTQTQPRKVIEAPRAPVTAVDAEELTQLSLLNT